jgi:hypothetical protein
MAWRDAVRKVLEDWQAETRFAHQVAKWRGVDQGRGPKQKIGLDYKAIRFMEKSDNGRLSIRRLAEMAVDEGLAAPRGGRDAKVQRLERFYAKWRKRRACK